MIKTLPFYAKVVSSIIIIWLLLYGIYIGQSILLPFGFSFLIAVLLRPLENFFLKRKLHRIIAILLTLIIAFLLLSILLMFLSYQIGTFTDDMPSMKNSLMHFVDEIHRWISSTFNLTRQEQQKVIDKAKGNGMDSVASSTLGFLTTSLTTIFLIPIYVFLFLYYRSHLLMFILQLFEDKHTEKVNKVITQIRYVVQHYVSGLLIETSIVAVLNCIGLFVVGAPYALLLGIIGALLNLIPYIGGLIAVLLTGIITLSNTGNNVTMLLAVGVYIVVQFIDNNLLVPRVIGSSVKLNALFSIIAVLIGGALCGVGGMFLSLPCMAICKVVFDHVEELEPWGKLLGDEEEARWRININYPGRRKKEKVKTTDLKGQ